jgi:hypothetical protein
MVRFEFARSGILSAGLVLSMALGAPVLLRSGANAQVAATTPLVSIQDPVSGEWLDCVPVTSSSARGRGTRTGWDLATSKAGMHAERSSGGQAGVPASGASVSRVVNGKHIASADIRGRSSATQAGGAGQAPDVGLSASSGGGPGGGPRVDRFSEEDLIRLGGLCDAASARLLLPAVQKVRSE